ncbi:hypothetical protein [Haloferula sp. BvORR071]|uniref:MGH1-like glycoside hydrolase domain-containing protein n=1 Tax=Haloferula sp. BvORR071 TaxID=1396141 RepID=UPI000556108D|nr:hypothetical protein [Haloferula sp. BvORR071]
MARLLPVLACAAILTNASASVEVATISSFGQAVKWLEVAAPVLVRASTREMSSGATAFPPQAGPGYEAFWLRDYSYVLEGCSNSLSDTEVRRACTLFLDALDPKGAGVDCIKFDGTRIYQPGYGSMGKNPVADGSLFTIEVAWQTHQRLRDKDYLAGIIGKLLLAHQGVPRNPSTGLVHITSEGWDRCPYGFTDSVRKQGDELFCSLLLIEADRHLATMLRELGRSDEAAKFEDEASALTKTVQAIFWDGEAGLFLAATGQGRQPDLWGSAFAVYAGIASPEQAIAIARYFQQHHAEIVQKGQMRHLPKGMYWDAACERDTYQNGGYWATPTGWLIYTLDLVDPKLAEQTLVDLVRDFQERGVNEWIFGEGVHTRNYLSSATLPLAGAKKMLERRAKANK